MNSIKSCLACPNPVAKDEILTCAGCLGVYHYACLGIPVNYYNQIINDNNSGWQFQSCNNVSRRRRGENTPARRHFERSPPVTADADMSICEEPRQKGELDYSTTNQSELDTNASGNFSQSTGLSLDMLSRLFDVKLAGVKDEIRSIDSKLSKTKEEICIQINKQFHVAINQLKKEFTDTTDFLSDQIKDVRKDFVTISNRVKSLESENSRLNAELLVVKKSAIQGSETAELKTVIDQMHQELNERDQALMSNDLEITGVPEHRGESPLHIVQAVSTKIGISLEDREVVSVERVGPQRPNSAGTNTKQHPRPLVLRLARKPLRDDLLRSARVRRGVDTSNIGLPEPHSPSRVYINERLTKVNRKLFWQVRQSGNAAGWRFTWTKEGCIYAKRTDGMDSKAIRIRSEKELEQVFGVGPTTSEVK